MPKKKRNYAFAQAADAAECLRLLPSVVAQTKFSVNCWYCGDGEVTTDDTAAEFVLALYDQGWRYIVSDKEREEGPTCPRCVKQLTAPGEADRWHVSGA